ncbi:TIGR02444 family protein [Vibrio sp. 10N.286.49.B3]|uniref:TIGR02444 family protein n=1 Tax=Vibrio sp. 10N.286.49.B3 TaxID=1880855 RepID=UPI000C83D870|nr:TIGR02444 family protein [Vibrio sp. 10N.286.49.B3]PMH46300.1 TIGR02444 family protein [Vibrio sp. 10N.286.49.B3]
MTNKHVESTLTTGELWQFSLQYYNVSEVKEACLTLQNHYRGNVNLLLLLKWLDEQQLSFGDDAWAHLHTSLQRSDALLHDYRYLRRQMKHHVINCLYRDALQFELTLEKQQQADLVAALLQTPLQRTDQSALVYNYCQRLSCPNLYRIFSQPCHRAIKQSEA